MPALPAKEETRDLSSSNNSAESENAVIFRGDGEPRSPSALLRLLAEAGSGIGFEPDSYSLGGNVGQLEDRFAEMLGKEAAIFMPTGTLANHLAIRALCGDKRRAIVQEQSHLYHDSGDCVTQLSGINLVPLARGKPYFSLDDLKEAVAESGLGRVSNPVGAMMIESPVRRQMGRVVPYGEMQAITEFCKGQGIGAHLDGARLYMMSAASGIEPREYAALFDTVYVSLYKYFGAPFGGILAGDSQLIDGMFHTRRMFGGGLASACFPAALALQGVQGFSARFEEALLKARELFESLNTLANIEIKEFDHGSNIFPLKIAAGVDVERLVDALHRSSVFVYPGEGTGIVSSLTVNPTILRQSNEAIFEAFRGALDAS